jgi:hypothetical protein
VRARVAGATSSSRERQFDVRIVVAVVVDVVVTAAVRRRSWGAGHAVQQARATLVCAALQPDNSVPSSLAAAK